MFYCDVVVRDVTGWLLPSEGEECGNQGFKRGEALGLLNGTRVGG